MDTLTEKEVREREGDHLQFFSLSLGIEIQGVRNYLRRFSLNFVQREINSEMKHTAGQLEKHLLCMTACTYVDK